jgi:hypothetical protein
MLAVIGETSAVERVGVLRVEFDCLAKVGDRALNVALGSVSVAAVEEYQRIFQLALDRLAVVRDGAIIVTHDPIGIRAVRKRNAAVWRQPDCVIVIRDCPIHVALGGK